MNDKPTSEAPRSAPSDIVEATTDLASRLFLERGYDNTPMSLIANELGLTKAGVYHYFESKEHLLYVIHKTTIENWLLPIILRAENEPDAEARLRCFVLEYARLLTRHPTVRVMITEAHRLAPDHLAEIRSIWRRALEMMRGALRELQQSGRCRPDVNATYAAFAAFGMCSWIYYWFDYSRPDSGDAVAQTMVDIFFSGVLARQGSDTLERSSHR